MEDSSWSGWTTPHRRSKASRSATRRVASSPVDRRVAGWASCARSTKATDDAVKYASRTWTQAQPEEFERDGRRRYVERATGVEYDLCHGNPMLGDDPELCQRVLRGGRRALVPAPGRPGRRCAASVMGSMGGMKVMRS